jgi:hypothetical protein
MIFVYFLIIRTIFEGVYLFAPQPRDRICAGLSVGLDSKGKIQ